MQPDRKTGIMSQIGEESLDCQSKFYLALHLETESVHSLLKSCLSHRFDRREVKESRENPDIYVSWFNIRRVASIRI